MSSDKQKIILENEEILLRIFVDILNVQKDMYALEVEREKIFGDMAVSMRDISEGVIEIAHKLPYIEDDDVTKH